MAYFDPNTTVDSKVRDGSIIPIKEGQFLMTTDTRSIFYDLGDRRIQLTDILEQILFHQGFRRSLEI